MNNLQQLQVKAGTYIKTVFTVNFIEFTVSPARFVLFISLLFMGLVLYGGIIGAFTGHAKAWYIACGVLLVASALGLCAAFCWSRDANKKYAARMDEILTDLNNLYNERGMIWRYRTQRPVAVSPASTVAVVA